MISSEWYESLTSDYYPDSSRSSSANDINSCSYCGSYRNYSNSNLLICQSIVGSLALPDSEFSGVVVSSLTIVPSKLVALICTMFLWSQSARIEISLYRQSRDWYLLNSEARPSLTFRIFTATCCWVLKSIASLTLYSKERKGQVMNAYQKREGTNYLTA